MRQSTASAWKTHLNVGPGRAARGMMGCLACAGIRLVAMVTTLQSPPQNKTLNNKFTRFHVLKVEKIFFQQ